MTRTIRDFVAVFIRLEKELGLTDMSNVETLPYLRACRKVESLLSTYAAQGVVLESESVAKAHQTFLDELGWKGEWTEGDWTEFATQIASGVATNILKTGSHSWILGQLTWGGYLESFGPTIGWLVMNGFREVAGEKPVYPQEHEAERLINCLRGYQTDSESLRGFMLHFDSSYPG